VNDAHFQKTWENVYLPHPALRIPWMAVLGRSHATGAVAQVPSAYCACPSLSPPSNSGNHDYMGYPMAQVQFSTAPTNPHGGLWKVRRCA
jgi:hypothetical protein